MELTRKDCAKLASVTAVFGIGAAVLDAGSFPELMNYMIAVNGVATVILGAHAIKGAMIECTKSIDNASKTPQGRQSSYCSNITKRDFG